MSTDRGERQSRGAVRLADGPAGAPGTASARGGRFPDALGTVGALSDALAPMAAPGAALAGDALGGPLAGTDTLGGGLGDGDALGGFDATGGAFNAMAHRDRPLGDSLGGRADDDALRGPVGGAVEDTDATAMALPAMPADVLAFGDAGIAGSADPLSTTDGPVRTGRRRGIAVTTTEVPTQAPAQAPAQAPTVPAPEPPRRSRSGERRQQRQGANRSLQAGSRQGAARPRAATRAFPPPSGPPAPMPPPPTVATPGTVPWQGHQPRHAAGPRRSRPRQKPFRTGRLIIGLIVLALFMSNVIQSCVRNNSDRFGGAPAPAPVVTSAR